MPNRCSFMKVREGSLVYTRSKWWIALRLSSQHVAENLRGGNSRSSRKTHLSIVQAWRTIKKPKQSNGLLRNIKQHCDQEPRDQFICQWKGERKKSAQFMFLHLFLGRPGLNVRVCLESKFSLARTDFPFSFPQARSWPESLVTHSMISLYASVGWVHVLSNAAVWFQKMTTLVRAQCKCYLSSAVVVTSRWVPRQRWCHYWLPSFWLRLTADLTCPATLGRCWGCGTQPYNLP